jgi:hypothetical protein
MTDRFDLEQQIMQCWNIIDDMDYLAPLLETDASQNMLIGLQSLYRAKFEKLWDCFEGYIKNK